MASTVFKDFSKPAITASWLNDVNSLTYGTGIAFDSSRVGYLQQGSGAVLTTLTDIANQYGLPKQFGVYGDGSIETNKLNKLLACGLPLVLLDPGKTYIVDGTLSVPAGVTLDGRGAKIKLTVPGIKGIEFSGSNSHIVNLIVEGVDNASERLGDILISAGSTNLNVSSTVLSNLSITNCKLINSGGYSIYLAYVKDCVVENNIIDNVRYGGVFSVSVENIKVNSNVISNITGLASNGNAYGVTFTASKNIPPPIGAVSRNCEARFNTISNVGTWNAIDTHGGENIVFEYNTITSCGFPIGVVSLIKEAPGGGAIFAPKNVRVHGNVVDNTVPPVTYQHSGIVLAGDTVSLAENCTISSNVFIRVGVPGNIDRGAILFRDSVGTTITGNTIKRPFAIGISIYTNNFGFSISGNTVVDAQDNTSTIPTGICVRAPNNSGSIVGNVAYYSGINELAFTGVRGFDIATGTGNTNIRFASNQSNYTLPFRGFGVINANLSFPTGAPSITDATGGTANTTLQAIPDTGTSSAAATIALNNNFADVALQINSSAVVVNKLVAALKENGIIV